MLSTQYDYRKPLPSTEEMLATPMPELRLGHPSPLDPRWFLAVRTENGQVLTGPTRAFTPDKLRAIDALPKYGKVVGYLQTGC